MIQTATLLVSCAKSTLDCVALWWHVVRVPEEEPIYGVEELAERAGVSRRTVRYYVQRGLLPPPTGVGRGKHYTERHLATLMRIRDQQTDGVSLEDIAARLAGHSAPPERVSLEAPARAARQSLWTRVVLAEGVELHLCGRRLRDAQLERLMNEITRVIESEEP